MLIFEDWLSKLNTYFNRLERKIARLVDNAGDHNFSVEFVKKLTHIKVVYLDPNCTSVIQPCDAGIIKAFKSKYRNKLIRHMLMIRKKKIQ